MLQIVRPPQPAAVSNCGDCPCAKKHSKMGDLTDMLPSFDVSSFTSNWQTWALIAAAVLALYFMLQSTPKRQEAAVARRKARAAYQGQLARIREEYR